MNTFATFLLILLVLVLGFAGYFYLDEIVPLRVAVQESTDQNQELRFQLQQMEQRNATLSQQLEERVRKISTEKNDEINRLKSTYEELIGGLQKEVEQGEVTITQLADRLQVNIVDRIIFPSGKAEVTLPGQKILRQVGNILKQVTDRRIRVEGHTDNVPIHPKLQAEFATNWELSVARATNVVRFLQEQVGIDPGKLEIAGLGQYQPVATNNTRNGRRQNRRIEILLLPDAKQREQLTQQKVTD